ncbi:hypothetical protein ACHAWF_016650 [Thalassiosira exigua]
MAPSKPSKPQDFVTAAKDIINISKCQVTFERRWNSAFGALPVICCLLWDELDPFNTMPNGVHFRHLLWALYLLKVYDTEHNSAQFVGGVDEKTFREWSFLFVDAISYLECHVILWENRFLGDVGNIHLVSLDGTDMRVQMKFAPGFMSHKFKGEIVWIHGPVRCGENDINISMQAFISFLHEDEKAEADRGYGGEREHITTPHDDIYRSSRESYNASVTRARHETVNDRFKKFGVLTKTFRHTLLKHSACFRAVAVITQLKLESGNPLFEVNYSDRGNY